MSKLSSLFYVLLIVSLLVLAGVLADKGQAAGTNYPLCSENPTKFVLFEGNDPVLDVSDICFYSFYLDGEWEEAIFVPYEPIYGPTIFIQVSGPILVDESQIRAGYVMVRVYENSQLFLPTISRGLVSP